MPTLRGPQHEPQDAVRATTSPTTVAPGATLEFLVLRGLLYLLAMVNFAISLNPGQANMVTGFLGMTLAVAALVVTARR